MGERACGCTLERGCMGELACRHAWAGGLTKGMQPTELAAGGRWGPSLPNSAPDCWRRSLRSLAYDVLWPALAEAAPNIDEWEDRMFFSHQGGRCQACPTLAEVGAQKEGGLRA
jgi:hypothetical protein